MFLKRLFCAAFLEIIFSPPIDVYGVNKSSDLEELPKLLKKWSWKMVARFTLGIWYYKVVQIWPGLICV